MNWRKFTPWLKPKLPQIDFSLAAHRSHRIEAMGAFFGEIPAFICHDCNIWSQITKKEFRTQFGIEFRKSKHK